MLELKPSLIFTPISNILFFFSLILSNLDDWVMPLLSNLFISNYSPQILKFRLMIIDYVNLIF